ncbi:MAG: ABC transporter substrate-binding protein [Oscillospiraceae bacterium]|jgi:peptide/nickel transport system substrate-binding protein|nr:ABC transporter substrate-binding protein [Oscillospiraceae bacterium]
MKQLRRLWALLLAPMLLLCACSPANTPSPDAGVRDSVTVSLEADPDLLCAGFAASTVVSFVSRQIFDTLIVRQADGSYAPSLAESWEYINDGKDIRFTLRDDVVFHNGETMTADDVVFSYNTVIQAGYADCSTSAMDRMEKEDDRHVVLYFKDHYGPGLECVSTEYMVVFPQTVYEADPDHFLRNPVGTGAYRFIEWKTGDKIQLEAFPDYFGGPAPIRNLIFKIYTDSSIAALAMEKGEIDVLSTPLQTDVKNLQAHPNLQYSEVGSATTTWVFFNFNGIFADKRLREAVVHAIDREAVLLGAMEGAGETINSMYPNFLPGSDPDYVGRQYDPELSRRLLAEAGYADGLDLLFQTRETERYYKPVEVIQAQLGEVGIRVRVEKLESSAWSSDVWRAANFEINLISSTLGIMDFDDLYPLYRGGEGQNFCGVDIPALNEAFDTNRYSTDEAARLQACRDIVRIMDEEAVVAPLYAAIRGLAAHKDLKNVEAHATLDYNVRDWSW